MGKETMTLESKFSIPFPFFLASRRSPVKTASSSNLVQMNDHLRTIPKPRPTDSTNQIVSQPHSHETHTTTSIHNSANHHTHKITCLHTLAYPSTHTHTKTRTDIRTQTFILPALLRTVPSAIWPILSFALTLSLTPSFLRKLVPIHQTVLMFGAAPTSCWNAKQRFHSHAHPYLHLHPHFVPHFQSHLNSYSCMYPCSYQRRPQTSHSEWQSILTGSRNRILMRNQSRSNTRTCTHSRN